LHIARLALGVNPAAAGAAWAAGKLTSHGARAIGERILHRQALQLLTDIIRVIGFEAATIYGGSFRHRDANWILGAALVNLEIAREADLEGRDTTLVKLCNLALRHEFDRIRLLHHLARHKPVDISRVRPQILMTPREREDIATALAAHCANTGLDSSTESIARWRDAIEQTLDIALDLQSGQQPRPPRSRWQRLRDRIGRKSGNS
jgi:hypothetical protein